MKRSTPSRAPLLAVFAVALAAGSTGACAALLGFERLSEDAEDAAPPLEASSDAGDPGDPDGGLCGDFGVPPQPAPGGEGDANAPEMFHVALRELDFGIDSARAPSGFNLDRVCSPTPQTGSCTTTIDEETFNKYARDHDERGLDNAGHGLLRYLGLLGDAFKPSEINARLQLGEFGAVIRVRGWNGAQDDDEVIVELFPALGLWQPDDGGGEPVRGGAPKLDATDLWRRDRRFQNIVDASTLKSATAWVRGGRLVASFQSVTLGMSVPDDPKLLDVVIYEGWMSAALVADGASFRLADGVLGGRWRTSDVLDQVRQIYIDDTVGIVDKYLCEPDLPFDVYGAVKKEVCDGRDLRGTGREDGQGLPCDAVSTGIRFESYAVDEPGEFDDRPTLPPRCEMAGAVPVGDNCP